MELLRRYFSFEGRISRSTFWLRNLLFWPLLYLTLVVVSMFFGEKIQRNYIASDISPMGVYIISAFAVIYIWLATCAEIQRWHDLNRSGWWWFMGLVPFIGGIYILAKCGFQKGTEGPNQFGPDPVSSND